MKVFEKNDQTNRSIAKPYGQTYYGEDIVVSWISWDFYVQKIVSNIANMATIGVFPLRLWSLTL